MKWELDKSRAICPQICEQLCVGIASGELESGAKLFSVREVAVSAGVNPNTVQKSFEQLEQKGIIYSIRGSGWYVGDDTSAAKEMVTKLISEKTLEYFTQMKALSLDETEIKQYVKEWQE
jgi:DNA-binding transcriptional regulator YhcF (GntR family)